MFVFFMVSMWIISIILIKENDRQYKRKNITEKKRDNVYIFLSIIEIICVSYFTYYIVEFLLNIAVHFARH